VPVEPLNSDPVEWSPGQLLDRTIYCSAGQRQGVPGDACIPTNSGVTRAAWRDLTAEPSSLRPTRRLKTASIITTSLSQFRRSASTGHLFVPFEFVISLLSISLMTLQKTLILLLVILLLVAKSKYSKTR